MSLGRNSCLLRWRKLPDIEDTKDIEDTEADAKEPLAVVELTAFRQKRSVPFVIVNGKEMKRRESSAAVA